MDVRHREVLIAVIREYVDSAEPVGSRVLAKRHFPTLSPATIRNAMADLEEMGYLAQPHTSAGRVPTDKAYRFYVNSFPPSQAPEAPAATGTLPTRHSGIDGFMERTSSHLSVATKLTGLLLAPPLKHTTLARVELIPLEKDRALAVLVTDRPARHPAHARARRHRADPRAAEGAHALRQRRHQHARPPRVLGHRDDARPPAHVRAEGAPRRPHDRARRGRGAARHDRG